MRSTTPSRRKRRRRRCACRRKDFASRLSSIPRRSASRSSKAIDARRRRSDQLDWPFFEERASRARSRGSARGRRRASPAHDPRTTSTRACRALVRALGDGGCCGIACPRRTAALRRRSTRARSACCARRLAEHDWPRRFRVRDAGPGQRRRSRSTGSEAQRARWLPRVAAAKRSPHLRCRSRDAGSDVAAMRCARDVDGERLSCSTARRRGSPTAASPISTACSRAPRDERGTRGISCFRRARANAGLAIAERMHVMAPHPLARLEFDGCAVPADAMIGVAGRADSSSRCARSTSSARRSLRQRSDSRAARSTRRVAHANARPMAGGTLADLPTCARRSARWRRPSMPARSSPTVRRGCATSCAARRRRKPRWPSSRPPKARSE